MILKITAGFGQSEASPLRVATGGAASRGSKLVSAAHLALAEQQAKASLGKRKKSVTYVLTLKCHLCPGSHRRGDLQQKRSSTPALSSIRWKRGRSPRVLRPVLS
jgi:hypothetical protein